MIAPELQALLAGRPLPQQVTSAVARSAGRAQVGPLLFTAARSQGSTLERQTAAALARAHLLAVDRHHRLTADLASVVRVVREHDAPVRLVKGLANAHLLYDDPSSRRSSDIDLYIGDWAPAIRAEVLHRLGLDRRRVAGVEQLCVSGNPVHEVTVPAGVATQHANIDAHFNPYGLITEFRGASVANCWRTLDLPGVGQVEVPTPEFALVIALMNQTRKGGWSLQHAADSARLLDGRAGLIDWDRYRRLVEIDGLESISAQALAAIARGLQLDVELPMQLPADVRRWAPVLGVDTRRMVPRRMTLVPLYRPARFKLEAVRALARWYLPGSAMLDARGLRMDDPPGVLRQWRAARNALRRL